MQSARIGNAKQFSLCRNELPQLRWSCSNAPGDRTDHRNRTAITAQAHGNGSTAGTPGVCLSHSQSRLRRFIVSARADPLRQQAAFALKLALGQQHACGGHVAVRRNCRRIAALDQRQDFAGANRIADTFKQSHHRAVGASGDEGIGIRRGFNHRRRKQDGIDCASRDQSHRDLGRCNAFVRDFNAIGLCASFCGLLFGNRGR